MSALSLTCNTASAADLPSDTSADKKALVKAMRVIANRVNSAMAQQRASRDDRFMQAVLRDDSSIKHDKDSVGYGDVLAVAWTVSLDSPCCQTLPSFQYHGDKDFMQPLQGIFAAIQQRGDLLFSTLS